MHREICSQSTRVGFQIQNSGLVKSALTCGCGHPVNEGEGGREGRKGHISGRSITGTLKMSIKVVKLSETANFVYFALVFTLYINLVRWGNND